MLSCATQNERSKSAEASSTVVILCMFCWTKFINVFVQHLMALAGVEPHPIPSAIEHTK